MSERIIFSKTGDDILVSLYSLIHIFCSPDLDPYAVTTNVKTENDDAAKTTERANVKLYVVVACIAALVLVAIIQASCTIFKMSRRGSSVQKVAWGIYIGRTGNNVGQ